MLKGPGLKENDLAPKPGSRNLVSGRTAAMKWPMGRVATWTVIWVMTSGSVRKEKNWLKKDNRAHEIKPKNHILNVHTGSVGSSVFVTVSRTSSMGETSSSSPAMSVGEYVFRSSTVPMGWKKARKKGRDVAFKYHLWLIYIIMSWTHYYEYSINELTLLVILMIFFPLSK